MSVLDGNSTVADWVTDNPKTASVFENLQIDYCCGGGASLAEACASKGLDAAAILSQLTSATAIPTDAPQESWQECTLSELCDHIESTHHAYLRSVLPRLTELIAKVVEAHSGAHPELPEVQRVFSDLREELEPHMMKEEQILFPAVREMEQAASQPRFPFGTVANPIRMMEHEHHAAGGGLQRLRELTAGYQLPEGACNTYQVMLHTLHELELDLHQHIHKENFILFPRAQELEASLSAAQP